MEVHAHTHPSTSSGHQKKWTHYLWEFLMLFLAVYCGFLAENFREHRVEKAREKEYIKTMISDLQADTASLNYIMNIYGRKGIELDSLIYLLNAPEIKEHGAELYYYGRVINRMGVFTCTDRTIEQMRNSGAFRLIRNDHAASSILEYYSAISKINFFQNNTAQEAESFTRSDSKTLFNALVFETMVNDKTNNEAIKPTGNPPLITYDKSVILNAISTLHYLQGSRRNLMMRSAGLKEMAMKLIELLRKEYHLE